MNRHKQRGKIKRNERGSAIFGLGLAMFLFLLLAGLFTFDICRVQMAQRQLLALAEAAALGGTAMMTSYDVSNDNGAYSRLALAQNNGMGYACNMVQVGSILGNQLTVSSAQLCSSNIAFQSPTAGKCNILVQLIAADGTSLHAPNVQGQAIKVSLCYGYKPVFLPVLVGAGSIPIQVTAIGGLPQIDSVVVFDFSGSMDDLTVVTFVDRVWDPNLPASGNETQNGGINYITLAPSTTQLITVPPAVPIFGFPAACFANYVGWNYNSNPDGTHANVLPPQSLDVLGVANYSNNTAVAQPALNYTPNGPLVYDSITRRWPGTNDYGMPPGNIYNTSNNQAPMYSGPGTAFTDLVVNVANPGIPPFVQPLYGPTPFAGFIINFSGWGSYTITDVSGTHVNWNYEPDGALSASYSYNFANIGVLVEASRGNMENATNLNGAFNSQTWTNGNGGAGGLPPYETTIGGATTVQPQVFPAAHIGYEKAYEQLAMLYSQPIATALDGAYSGFYQQINSLADCRYGFVGFSDASANMINYPGYNNLWGLLDYTDTNGTYQLYYRGYAAPSDHGNYSTLAGSNATFFWSGQQGVFPVILGRVPIDETMSQLNSFEWAINMFPLVPLGWTAALPWQGVLYWQQQASYSVPAGGTDSGEALLAAAMNFNATGSTVNYQYSCNGIVSGVDRRAARRAVIFFTDGIPTDQAPGPPTGTALTAAQALNSAGIAIYTIGLAINNNILTDQQQYLTGLVSTVSNGSAYFPCTSAAEVKNKFIAVVRRLTQGERSH